MSQGTFGHCIWLTPLVYCQYNIHQSKSIKMMMRMMMMMMMMMMMIIIIIKVFNAE